VPFAVLRISSSFVLIYAKYKSSCSARIALNIYRSVLCQSSVSGENVEIRFELRVKGGQITSEFLYFSALVITFDKPGRSFLSTQNGKCPLPPICTDSIMGLMNFNKK
jgi:hypothetical protein